MACETRMKRLNEADLYVVITEAYCKGRSSLEVLEAVLAAGVRLVQLREKECDDRALYELAMAYRERTAEYGAVLMIDDRLDIAAATGADGVHLGQHDLPVEVAREMSQEMIIGASSHSLAEAVAVQAAGADFINIGPIFATQTKDHAAGPLGPEALDQIVPHLTVPWSCMGGIKLETIGEVLDRGARHPAVVTAVTGADDVKGAAEALRKAILDRQPVA